MSSGAPRTNRLLTFVLAFLAGLLAGLAAASPSLRRMVAKLRQGYAVDDQLLERKVVTELDRMSGAKGMSEVDVVVGGGQVTLKGVVDTRDQILLAETAVRSLPEVRKFTNELTAREDLENASRTYAAAGSGEGAQRAPGIGR